ncbi:hypothetical protein FACS189425_06940 [Clostridia bacterium]|nr:hypothetical protein FACS189425_06940 [Clostridia bacterium]
MLLHNNAQIQYTAGVDAYKVYTIEGNTSSNPGVVPNGRRGSQENLPAELPQHSQLLQSALGQVG